MPGLRETTHAPVRRTRLAFSPTQGLALESRQLLRHQDRTQTIDQSSEWLLDGKESQGSVFFHSKPLLNRETLAGLSAMTLHPQSTRILWDALLTLQTAPRPLLVNQNPVAVNSVRLRGIPETSQHSLLPIQYPLNREITAG